MNKLIRILLVFLFLTAPAVLYADYEDIGTGARAQGMGNAFTALADDSLAVYYNPGGLGYLRRGQVAFDYSRLYMGLDDGSNISRSFISAAFPLKMTGKKYKVINLGTAGIGISNLSLSGIYTENAFYMSYGKRIKEKYSAGVTLKMLNESYMQNNYTAIDPVFNYGVKGSVNAISLDAGALFNFLPRFFFGIALQNINQPNIGITGSEPLPLNFKMGVGYSEKDLKADIDIVSVNKDNSINAGFEKWIRKQTIAIRSGLEIGSRDLKKLSIGGSYNLKTVLIDYSFTLPLSGIADTMGIHKFSIVYRFGRIPEDEVVPGSLEEAYYKLEEEAKQLKIKLEDAETEKGKLEKALVDDAIAKTKERIKEMRVVTDDRPRQQVSGPANVNHIVTAADTLQSLAQKYYGDSNKWIDIFNENKDKVGRGGSLVIGQTIVVPNVVRQKPAEPVRQYEQPKQKETQEIQETPAATGQPSAVPVQAPAEIPEKKAEAPAPKQKTYVVKDGDTLPKIAQELYGSPAKWTEIYKANKDKIPKGKVEAGQVLVIP